jgi:beta-aspartyl-peptidase (threonine type)
MTRLLLVLSAALPLLFAAPARAEDDAARAIREVLSAQVAAWNKGDLEGFMRGYWDSDRLTFFSGNMRNVGWKATLERYQKKYKSEGKEMGKLAFRDLEIEVLSADAAVVKGRFELDLGKEKPTGLFTLIFRKTPDGWRIVHDHTSG